MSHLLVFFFSCIHNVATKIFCPLELCVTLCLQRNRERNGRRITSVNLLVLVCYKEKKNTLFVLSMTTKLNGGISSYI